MKSTNLSILSAILLITSFGGCNDNTKEDKTSPEQVKRKKCENLYNNFKVCSKELQGDEQGEKALLFEGENEFISECLLGLGIGKNENLTEKPVGYQQLIDCTSDNPTSCSVFLECTMGKYFSPSYDGINSKGQDICIRKCNRKFGYTNPRTTSFEAQRCTGRCMRKIGMDL